MNLVPPRGRFIYLFKIPGVRRSSGPVFGPSVNCLRRGRTAASFSGRDTHLVGGFVVLQQVSDEVGGGEVAHLSSTSGNLDAAEVTHGPRGLLLAHAEVMPDLTVSAHGGHGAAFGGGIRRRRRESNKVTGKRRRRRHVPRRFNRDAKWDEDLEKSVFDPTVGNEPNRAAGRDDDEEEGGGLEEDDETRDPSGRSCARRSDQEPDGG